MKTYWLDFQARQLLGHGFKFNLWPGRLGFQIEFLASPARSPSSGPGPAAIMFNSFFIIRYLFYKSLCVKVI